MGKTNPKTSSTVQGDGQTKKSAQTKSNSKSNFKKARSKAISRLIKEGLNRQSAFKLAYAHPPELIIKQCDALAKRSTSKNRLGLLWKSIEEDWEIPEAKIQSNSTKKSGRYRIVTKKQPQPLDHSPSTIKKLEAALNKLKKSPKDYQAFLDHERSERKKIEDMPMMSQTLITKVLEAFDSPGSRLKRVGSAHTQARPSGAADKAALG